MKYSIKRIRHLRLAVWRKFVICLGFSALIWTGSVHQVFADPIKSNSRETFHQAELYFHSGNFDEARPLYQKYFDSHPRGDKIDRVLFRLGQLDQRTGSYATALRYYQILLDKYPGGSLANQMGHVSFLMGECYLELGQHPEAERSFRSVTAKHPDMKFRWQALYHLGTIDEKRFDFAGALEKLVRVYQQNDHKGVQELARQEIATIIDEKLSEETLHSLSEKYEMGFPADLLLLKLVSIYRSRNDIENFKTVASEFFNRFPDHLEGPRLEDMTNKIAENKNGKIRLGVVLPLTGKRALTGQQVLQGIQLALNHQGGRAKESVELVVRDSVGGKSLTQIMQELAGDPYLVGIIGPVLSGEVKEIVPIVEKFKIPVFTPTASTEGLPEMSPYIFRNALTRRIQAGFLAEYAINELNLNRFAILYPEENYGLEFQKLFKEEIESLGGEVVISVTYDRKQTDFREQILELGGIPDDKLESLIRENLFDQGENLGFGGPNGRLSRPMVDMGHWNNEELENLKASLELSYDAIFIPGFYDKVGLIVPQLVFYNIENVTLLGGNGWNSPKLVEIAGNYIKKGFFVDGFFTRSRRPEVEQFVAAFKSNFGKEPSLHSAQAYDSASIMIQSILKGADNRIKVKNHLDSLIDYPGVSGKTTMLSTGDSSKELFTLRINKREVQQVN